MPPAPKRTMPDEPGRDAKRPRPDGGNLDVSYVDWLRECEEDERLSVLASVETELHALSGERVAIMELFNPYRFRETAQTVFNMTAGPAYDLRVGKVSDPEVQEEVWAALKRLTPWLVIG